MHITLFSFTCLALIARAMGTINDGQNLVGRFRNILSMNDETHKFELSIQYASDIYYIKSNLSQDEINSAEGRAFVKAFDNTLAQFYMQYGHPIVRFVSYIHYILDGLRTAPAFIKLLAIPARGFVRLTEGADPRKLKLVSNFFKELINEEMQKENKGNLVPYLSALIYGNGLCSYLRHPDDPKNELDVISHRKFSLFVYLMIKFSEQFPSIDLSKKKEVRSFVLFNKTCEILAIFPMDERKRKGLLMSIALGKKIEKFEHLPYKLERPSMICNLALEGLPTLSERFPNIRLQKYFYQECIDDLGFHQVRIESSKPWYDYLDRIYNYVGSSIVPLQEDFESLNFDFSLLKLESDQYYEHFFVSLTMEIEQRLNMKSTVNGEGICEFFPPGVAKLYNDLAEKLTELRRANVGQLNLPEKAKKLFIFGYICHYLDSFKKNTYLSKSTASSSYGSSEGSREPPYASVYYAYVPEPRELLLINNNFWSKDDSELKKYL